jgi:hypothetical protein
VREGDGTAMACLVHGARQGVVSRGTASPPASLPGAGLWEVRCGPCGICRIWVRNHHELGFLEATRAPGRGLHWQVQYRSRPRPAGLSP